MRKKLLISSLLYILMLKQQLSKISIIWLLIIPIQTFFLMLMSIQYNIAATTSPAQSNINIISVTLVNIWEKINDQNVLFGFFVTVFSASFVILVLFVVFVMFKKPLNQFDRRVVYLAKAITVSAVLIMAIQVLMFSIVWHVKDTILQAFKIIPKQPQSFLQVELYMYFIMLPAIVFITILNSRIRVMSAHYAILFMLLQHSLALSYANAIIGILSCIWVIKKDQNHNFLVIRGLNIRKIAHLMLFGFFLWKLVDNFGAQQEGSQNQYTSYIYLGSMIGLGAIIGIIKFNSKVNNKLPQVIQLCQCRQNLQKDPQDKQSKIKSMNIITEYLNTATKTNENQRNKGTSSNINSIGVQSKFCSQYNSNLINELQFSHSLQLSPEDMTLLINLMISQQYEKQPTLQLGINMIKCKLMIKDKKLFETIQLMKCLIEKYKNQSLTSKYQIFKIVFKIEEAYFKKHQSYDNPIIHIVREVDRLNEIFYKCCCRQIQNMYRFWEAVVLFKMKQEEDGENNPNPSIDKVSVEGGCERVMQNLMVLIHQGLQQLQKTMEKIEQLSIANREQKVLDYIKFLTTYTYEQHSDFSHGLQLQRSAFPEQNTSVSSHLYIRTDYSQYLQIVNSRVTNISLKLATQLGYKKLQVIDEHLTLLMPKQYQQQIESAIVNHHQPIYHVSYLVPLICSDNTIVLKKVISYLQLDCQFGYRVLFHLQPHASKQPLILYSTISNTIQYYNMPFLSTYKIDKVKIDAKIRNKYLNPDEIFLDIQLSDRNIQNKLAEGGFETQYNCRMFASKIGVRRAVRIENVRLGLIEKEMGYMVIKVIKGHRIKSMIGQMEDSMRDTKSNSQSSFFSLMQYDLSNSHTSKILQNTPIQTKNNQTQSEQQSQNEIFCRIQNPYQSKISSKKNELTKSTKFTLKFYAVLAIVVAMLLLVTQGFTFLHISNQIKSVLEVRSSTMIGEIQLYTRLMLAYQNFFNYQLVSKFGAQLQQQRQDYQQMLLVKFATEIQSQIQKFQKEYLDHLVNPSYPPIQYQLKFSHYSISATTATTNLFDFAQNLLRYQDDNEAISFLLHNYRTFSNLVFQIMDKNFYSAQQEKEISSLYFIYYATSGAIFIIAMACLIISTVFSIKIGVIRAEIQLLFRFMKLKNLQTVFKGLKTLRQRILQIKQEGLKQQRKFDNLMNYCLQHEQQPQKKTPIQKLQKTYQSTKQKNVSAEFALPTKKASEHQNLNLNLNLMLASPNSTSRHLSPLNSDRVQQNIKLNSPSNSNNGSESAKDEHQIENLQSQSSEIEKSKQAEAQEEQQHYKKPIKVRNLGFFGYFSVIAIICLTTLLQILHLNQKIQISLNILQFKLQNKKISENLIHQILESQNYLLLLKLTETNSSISHPSVKTPYTLFQAKRSVNSYKLPDKYFYSYSARYFEIVMANICLNPIGQAIKQCEGVLGGIFQYGVRRTIQNLNSALLDWTNKQELFQKSITTNYSKLEQIIITKQTILSLMSSLQQSLVSFQQNFSQEMARNAMQIFILGVVLSFARFVMTFIMKKYIYRASKIGVGYFLILPKKVLLQSCIVDHLRKNDVLNRISNI